MPKRVSLPHLGKYTGLIKKLGGFLKWDVVLPPVPSEETVGLGVRHMNEMMCLPAKVTLGSFIQVSEGGVQDFIMFDSCGQCRLKTYWILQQRVLRKLGYNATIHPVRLGPKVLRDIKAIDPSISYWKALRAVIGLFCDVLKLDKELWHELPDETSQVRIGIVGEIYTILEPTVNKNLVKKIEKMGALAHNSLPLSYFIFKRFYNRGWLKRRGVDRKVYLIAQRRAHKYFPKGIGGHGNESIIHTIYYALKKFDGVIHVLPFPCMPESTVAAVLDDISRDYNIPVMRLIFDAHTAEAGLDTRLEAFVDVLKRKKVAQNSRNKKEV